MRLPLYIGVVEHQHDTKSAENETDTDDVEREIDYSLMNDDLDEFIWLFMEQHNIQGVLIISNDYTKWGIKKAKGGNNQ